MDGVEFYMAVPQPRCTAAARVDLPLTPATAIRSTMRFSRTPDLSGPIGVRLGIRGEDEVEYDYAEVLRRVYELFDGDDAYALPDLWTDDIVWHSAGSNIASGDHAGASAVIAMLGDLMAATEGTYHVTSQAIAVDGDRGFSLHKATAATADGVAEMWTVLSFRFREGKIAEIWNYPFDQELADRVLSWKTPA